jgi:ACS family hexuronate transporter-like MFS transporter
LIKKGWPILKARKMVLLLFACLELSILFTRYASQAWLVVLLISLAVAVHQAWATNIFTLATDLFPKEAVSSVAGIAGMAGAVGGIFFPLLVGSILDRFKAVDHLTGGYHLIFSICAFTYLFAWLIIHLLTRKSGRVELAELIPKG